MDIDINFIKTNISFLRELEAQSSCASKHIGCVIGSEKGIISGGYNNCINKNQRCDKLFKKIDGHWYHKIILNCKESFVRDTTIDEHMHREWSTMNEVHAEIAAISGFNSTKYNADEDGELYAFVTYSPCVHCLKSLINLGVKKIYFFNKFDDYDILKKQVAEKNNIKLIQIFRF